MRDSNTFQIIVLVIFGVFILVGFASFVLIQTASDNTVTVSVWGSVEGNVMDNVLSNFANNDAMKISYVYKSPETFDEELVNALAAGTGPDMVIVPQESIWKHQDKLLFIPYDAFPERDFKETYIEEGELFLWSEGIAGLPFSVDPLVMYWNRDLFSNAGIAAPPRTWDEFLTLVPKLTQRDRASNIVQSAAGLGEFRNIDHAKEIIAALLLQAGNPIVTDSQLGLVSTLDAEGSVSAVDFYTEFANPVKLLYSWNRSLPSSKSFFIAGDLAIYFGFASEFPEFREKNPNLNFDVALLPQLKDVRIRKTFGRMHGVAITRQSANPTGAISAAFTLTSAPAIATLSSFTGLPPVRRDLLQTRPQNNAALSMFYDSALLSRSWIDPNPARSRQIFEDMIESITSGKNETIAALRRANQELNQLFR